MGTVALTICGVIFLTIMAALVFHTTISRFIDGAMSGLVCLLILGFYVALLVLILTIPSWTAKWSLSFVMFAALVLLPVISRSLSDSNHSSLDDEKMKSYRQAIALDPRNLAARAKLAELLYKRGLLEDAITEMTVVVRTHPGSVVDENRLKYMLAEREERKSPPIKCPSCGLSNPSGRRYCVGCESELSISREIRSWLLKGGLKQIVILSSLTILVLTAVLLGFAVLPLILRIIAVLVILLIVISAEFLYMQRNW